MRKSAQLSVRITEQEMANLRELATRESVLLSQLIRGILAANSKQTGVAALFRRFTTSRPTPSDSRIPITPLASTQPQQSPPGPRVLVRKKRHAK